MSDQNPLSQNFTIKSLLKFAFPTILMMIFMGLYTVVDTIFVARFVDINALSALNIVCPVINLIVGLGTMIATGGSAIVARKMGAGEQKRAEQDFTLIISVGILFGVLIAVFGTVFIDRIVWGLGANSILFPYCKEYLFILLLFTPASILQVLFQNLIVTAGRPGMGMVLGVSAGIVNILLDYIFMVPFHMGIKGAAFGTGIGYMIPAVIGLWFFSAKRGSLHFRKPVIDFSVLAESCSNGFSEMVSQAATAVTTFLFNRIMMKLLGENGVAAITIIIYTQFLLSALYIGFSMGVAPVISYNYGKQDEKQLKNVFAICMQFIVFVSVTVFAVAFIFGSCFCRKGNSCLRNCAKWIFDFPIQFSILWTEYFYLCHIYCIIKREAVSNFVVPADFRTDYSAVAYIAKYFGRNRGMACSTDSRANHYGCSIGFSSSEQREVSLRIKEDVHAVRRLIKKPLCGGKIIMRQNRI